MSEQQLRRLQRIRDRQRRRRRNPTPEQVYECLEDCDELLRIAARLAEQQNEENK